VLADSAVAAPVIAAGRRSDERAAAMPGDDQSAITQHFNGMPQRLIRDAQLFGKVPFTR